MFRELLCDYFIRKHNNYLTVPDQTDHLIKNNNNIALFYDEGGFYSFGIKKRIYDYEFIRLMGIYISSRKTALKLYNEITSIGLKEFETLDLLAIIAVVCFLNKNEAIEIWDDFFND